MNKLNKNLLGIFFMTLGMFCLSVNDITYKNFSFNFPVWEAVFFRALSGSIISIFLVYYSGPKSLKTKKPIRHFIRAFSAVGCVVLYIYGIKYLLLSENMNFYKSFNDSGIVDLLMLGMSGEAILDTSVSKYIDLVNISFLGNEKFKGNSIVTFTDIEIVGKAGMPIDFELIDDHSIELSFALPMRTALHGNIPNPFSKITKINYSLSDTNSINLSIYNSEGILVRELFDGSQGAGYYNILWDGMNNNDVILPNGHYTLQMLTNNFIDSITMTLLK